MAEFPHVKFMWRFNDKGASIEEKMERMEDGWNSHLIVKSLTPTRE